MKKVYWMFASYFVIAVVTAFVVVLAYNKLDSSDETTYVYGTNGIVKADKAFGIPKADLVFLKEFWKPLMSEVPESRKDIRDALKAGIETGFAEHRALIDNRFPELSEREKLIVYIMLRVNGSVPIFNPRNSVPDDINLLLVGERGNCSDYAIRTVMVLDVFGIKGRLITLFSSSLPGYVVADSFDPVSGKAYMIDSNLNIMSMVESDGKGFFDIIIDWTDDERERYFENGTSILITAPFYMRYYDPGVFLHNGTEFSYEDLNRILYTSREKLWRKTLAYEVPEIVGNWFEYYPGGVPQTLESGMKALDFYSVENVLPVDSLLKKAGINLHDNRVE